MIHPSILKVLRDKYKPGMRVELIEMIDPQAPPVGTRGTVVGVDALGSIMVNWDNGSTLNVLYRVDHCKVVSE